MPLLREKRAGKGLQAEARFGKDRSDEEAPLVGVQVDNEGKMTLSGGKMRQRPPERMKKITIEVSEVVYGLLEVLTKGERAPRNVEAVVSRLVDHAQQGVYRPGAWERNWLGEVFGFDWVDHLELGDPYGRPNSDHLFQRPIAKADGKDE